MTDTGESHGPLVGRATTNFLGALLTAAVLTSGCVSFRQLAGFQAEPTPTVSLRLPRWVLVENPRFGDVRSEPQYIWVEETKIPWTFKRLLFGKRAVLAPSEIVAKYGSPPGGAKISPLQGGPYVVDELSTEFRGQPGSHGVEERAGAWMAGPPPTKGYVVYVDSDRVVIDLTAEDGVRSGSMVSLRRDKIQIIHPVTGEHLGELEQEVATAKVVEVRERFSVAEIQSNKPGREVRVKDRAVLH